MRELRGRAERLLGTAIGFTEVLVGPVSQPIGKTDLPLQYFVMEHVGPSLEELAWRQDHGFRGWTLGQVALMAQQLIRRLQVMHTSERSLGLVHNDIKPANVLFHRGNQQLYLIDLDTVHTLSSTGTVARQRHVQGTPLWTGVDALLRETPSPKSDLDSLGQLLIWCVSGKLPWTQATQAKLAEEKQEWRRLQWEQRPGVECFEGHPAFVSFFASVEALTSASRNVDYDAFVHLFDSVASRELGDLSLLRDDVSPKKRRCYCHWF